MNYRNDMKVVRLRAHNCEYLEVCIYKDGGLNIYKRSQKQLISGLAVDNEDEKYGGWAVRKEDAHELAEALGEVFN